MNDLIDCHSHILYGLDDGARTIDEAVAMLKGLKKLGFSAVILTPHFDRTYRPSLQERKAKFAELDERAAALGMKLYLANEVHLTDDLPIHLPEISTLGNYIFLELSLSNKRANFVKYLKMLDNYGLRIILVHPERYSYLTMHDYRELYDYGLKFQLNYGSILGLYGTDAKKKAKWLLENGMVDLLGTDIHFNSARSFSTIKKAISRIIRLVGRAEFEELSHRNAATLFRRSNPGVELEKRISIESTLGMARTPKGTSVVDPEFASIPSEDRERVPLRTQKPKPASVRAVRPRQSQKPSPESPASSAESTDSPAETTTKNSPGNRVVGADIIPSPQSTLAAPEPAPGASVLHITPE